jgi:hypothetical protein
MVGNKAPAMSPPLTMERREILDCMCVPRWVKDRAIFPHFESLC